jgi:hypothetical protein
MDTSLGFFPTGRVLHPLSLATQSSSLPCFTTTPPSPRPLFVATPSSSLPVFRHDTTIATPAFHRNTVNTITVAPCIPPSRHHHQGFKFAAPELLLH